MIYFGVVEDRDDPKQMGRVRVRVMGLHSESLQDIPTNLLPWSSVINPVTSASSSEVGQTPHLLPGTWVAVMFTDMSKQNSIVLGSIPGFPSERREGEVGFKDPSNTYPLYIGESDLPFESRLERYQESTTFKNKLLNRVENVPTATRPRITSVAEDKPESEYELSQWNEFNVMNDHVPRYPYNHVRKSETGITEEIDDTPFNARHGIFHPSGTYEETYRDGSRALHVEGYQKVFIREGCDIYVANDCNLTVNGNMTHYVIGDYKLEVTGDYTRNIHGSIQTKVGQNVETEIVHNRSENIGDNDKLSVGIDKIVSVSQDYKNTTGRDLNFYTTRNHDNTVLGNLSELVYGNYGQVNFGVLSITSSGDIKIETPSNYSEDIDGTQTSDVSGAVTEIYGSTQNTTAGGDITIVGGPNINLNP